MRLNYGNKFYFQEDNCRVHKVKSVNNFMMTNHVNVLEWPDLSIVENVCKLISDIVYDRPSFQKNTNLEEAI